MGKWRFDGSGEWEMMSSIRDGEYMAMWRIQVCDDGTFSIAESDAGLTERKETFATLAAAKAFCEASEHANSIVS